MTERRRNEAKGGQKMKQKGFSLVEVLIALVILAVGLLGVTGMQITAIRGNHFSGNLTQATVLAQNKLEELKHLPYYDPKLSSGQPPQQIADSGVVYTVQYNVTALGNTMKNMTATVKWVDGGDRSVTLSAIRSR
jgi:type IV pilus assembly protein PilV